MARAPLSPSLGGPSVLPTYTPKTKDAISRVGHLADIHADPSHPARVALLSGLDLKKDSVRIYAFAEGGIMLSPQDVLHDSVDEQESWGKAIGYLQVVNSSSKKKHVDQIKIQFVVRQTISFPNELRPETDEVFTKDILLGSKETGGVWLEKGINTYEFLLNVPPDCPVSGQVDTSPLAITSHYAVGTVVGSAKGLFGKDLTAETAVWVFAGAEEEDLGLNQRIESFETELGPYTIDCTSSRFIVAAPLCISLSLLSPPPTLTVYALKVYLDQTVVLTSFRDPNKVSVVHLKGIIAERGMAGNYTPAQLAKQQKKPDQRLFDGSSGQSWIYETFGTLPTDRTIRPTTHDNTRSSIRTTSELVVDLYFTSSSPDKDPSKIYIATIFRKEVVLRSCFLLKERISLPDYKPKPEQFVPISNKIRSPCLCDDPPSSLIAAEQDFIKRAAAATTPASTPPLMSPEEDVRMGRGRWKIGEMVYSASSSRSSSRRRDLGS